MDDEDEGWKSQSRMLVTRRVVVGLWLLWFAEGKMANGWADEGWKQEVNQEFLDRPVPVPGGGAYGAGQDNETGRHCRRECCGQGVGREPLLPLRLLRDAEKIGH